jgi:DNA-binding NarL/FixJ family response regulator
VTGPTLKILSCEDHALFRDGLRGVVAELPDAPELIGAGSAAEAFRVLEADPDVCLVLLDLALPDADGFDVLRAMRERHPLVAVAVVSASESPRDVREALEAGASGFIPKSAERGVLLGALQMVLAGGVYAPPGLLRDEPATAGLTPRQVEVARLMAKGLTNAEIADVLGIGAGTVKTHVAAILETLEVSNRTEAVSALIERGVLRG